VRTQGAARIQKSTPFGMKPGGGGGGGGGGGDTSGERVTQSAQSASKNVAVTESDVTVSDIVTVSEFVTESIFGFSRLFVCDVNAFNAGVRGIVDQV
jgi:hypothetical protein